MCNYIKLVAVLVLSLCLPTTTIALTSVKLGWTPNSESNLAGYKVHWGPTTRNYTGEKDVALPTIADNQVVVEVDNFVEDTTYYFAATAYDTDKFSSDYSEEAVWTAPINSLDVVVDNNSSTGVVFTNSLGVLITDWELSKAVHPYNSDSVYSKAFGATAAFESEVSGQCNISMWWTEYSNRYNNVKIEIYNNTTLLDTVFVDQRTNGNMWNVLGTYIFSGVAKVVIVADDPAGINSTCADAVRFTASGVVYPAIIPTDITIEFSEADMYTGTIYIGTTDKDITLTWPAVDGAVTYEYRLYDINKKAFMQTGSVTTALVTLRLPATGLYRLDIKADNMVDWVSAPARLSGWPAGAGNLELF